MSDATPRLLLLPSTRPLPDDPDVAYLRSRYDASRLGRLSLWLPFLFFIKAWRADIVVAWECDLTAAWGLALARLCRRHTILFPRALPELLFGEQDYSLLGGIFRGMLARGFFRLVNLTLSSSAETTIRLREYLDRERHRVITLSPRRDDIADDVKAVERPFGAVTVADINARSIKRDRLDLFNQLAMACPATPFYIVGDIALERRDWVLTLAPNLLVVKPSLINWAMASCNAYCQLCPKELCGARLERALSQGLTALAYDNGALPASFFEAKGRVVSEKDHFDKIRDELKKSLAWRKSSASRENVENTRNSRDMIKRRDADIDRALMDLLGLGAAASSERERESSETEGHGS